MSEYSEKEAGKCDHKKLDIRDILEAVNIVDLYNDDKEEDKKFLVGVGITASEGYEADLTSRKHFEEQLSVWTKLALQITDKKTYPWKDASNVKYPLLATAAMQFAARAYPSLVPSNGEVVKCRVLGSDPDESKKNRAMRVGKYMSYQIIDEMEEWEEEMDKLLITLPIAGTVFKKTYFDSEKQRNVSCVVMPKDLVVNYWAKDLESAERITETFRLSRRKLEEKARAGLYCEVDDLGEPAPNERTVATESDPHKATSPEVDSTTPFVICEQHAFLDLDQDGYPEPYVITFEENSKRVLRIVARFTDKDVMMNEEGEIAKITPQQFYTKYGFVPNPDGGFYCIGFGRLLGSINEACDSLINQIIDSGSLNNMQSGFIAKGLRAKMGEAAFRPGEWRVVNATGQDLKQGIMPLPLKEPSKVLMELLNFLLQSGKELASVAEIFVGKMPGQNTPATTTMASIEQGMKVFTAVYKRVFRAMTSEFRKIYSLNRMYLDPSVYVDFIDEEIAQEDFTGPENQIVPAADPASISAQEKQVKVQAMMQLMPMGVINPMAFAKYYLDAFEVPNAESFLMEPQPQPDPEVIRMEKESQIEQALADQKIQNEAKKAAIKEAEGASKVEREKELSALKIRQEAILGNLKTTQAAQNASQSNQAAVTKQAIDTRGKVVKQALDQRGQAQKLRQNEELHKQKLKQAKEAPKKKGT